MPSVSIIGAGPAGAIAAICLCREGWEVNLFEQHRFPREKVCGECLSPLALGVLREVDLDGLVWGLGGAVLNRAVLVEAAGREVSLALPQAMRGISRSALDAALLEAARTAGARIHQPARVEYLDVAGQALTARHLADNSLHAHGWDYVLISDGKAAFASDRPPATRDLGVQAHFSGVRDQTDAISLFSLRGHYCGLAPVEGGSWNLAMSVPIARVQRVGGDLDRLLRDMVGENAGLAKRIADAKRILEWHAAPLPRFAVRARWPMRVIPIGNAAAALEPIGGEGMGLAMRSAQLAANALVTSNGIVERFDARALIREYRRLWNRRRLACRAGAMVISNPLLARLAVCVLRLNQFPGSIFLGLTGKRAPL
jgi:flavin-dependent dehydrogenase